MNRIELIELVKAGKTVTLNLTEATVVSVRSEIKPVNHYHGARMYKIIVNDPTFGTIYFGSFSSKVEDVYPNDKISLKVTVTGMGDASKRYPDPILFAKAHTRKGESIALVKPVVFDPTDLTVNV